MHAVPHKGPWDPDRIARFLDEAVMPIRLAALAPSGFPTVVSLWFLRREAAIWCASRPNSRIVRLLRLDPRAAFEIAGDRPPYRGLRGQARATLVPEAGGAVLQALVERYLGGGEGELARWLLARADEEVAIRLDPVRLTSWDYHRRMGG